MMCWTCWKTWLKAAGIRALKTVAQTAVATIGTTAVMNEVDWVMVGSASVLAGILSLLTSLAGLPECKDGEDTTHEDGGAFCLGKNWGIRIKENPCTCYGTRVFSCGELGI